ncbi:hypothetical protein NDU88_001868 [Pleurodeles waltl]|uniref:Uncharacterized protein n=1 Tax=Pleurodeles waltl TaxID=8319 RepID=A0AAV7WLV0_PLEWA|nr:hypothetical protein NDU88_001868 [Pleurodeles waltl]
MKGSRSYGGGCTGVVPFPPWPRHFFFSRLDSLLGPRFAGNDFIRCQGARFAGIVCAGLSASLRESGQRNSYVLSGPCRRRGLSCMGASWVLYIEDLFQRKSDSAM